MEVESLTMYKPWNELSISEKSEMMKAAIRNGITNLNDIKEKYNEFAEGGPKYKKSTQSYYDPNTDTIYAPDSIGEFYKHEWFHARPDTAELQRLKPYYDNLNDQKLLKMGADLPFVKQVEGDPGHYYSPEEIGARVAAARYMLKKQDITTINNDFLNAARKQENTYGDNFRDLLHMYDNNHLLEVLGKQFAKGGPEEKGEEEKKPQDKRDTEDNFIDKVIKKAAVLTRPGRYAADRVLHTADILGAPTHITNALRDLNIFTANQPVILANALYNRLSGKSNSLANAYKEADTHPSKLASMFEVYPAVNTNKNYSEDELAAQYELRKNSSGKPGAITVSGYKKVNDGRYAGDIDTANFFSPMKVNEWSLGQTSGKNINGENYTSDIFAYDLNDTKDQYIPRFFDSTGSGVMRLRALFGILGSKGYDDNTNSATAIRTLIPTPAQRRAYEKIKEEKLEEKSKNNKKATGGPLNEQSTENSGTATPLMTILEKKRSNMFVPVFENMDNSNKLPVTNDVKVEPEDSNIYKILSRDTDKYLIDAARKLEIENRENRNKSTIDYLKSLNKDEVKAIQRKIADSGFYDNELNIRDVNKIKAIQRNLVNKGYLHGEKEIDGIIGEKTKAAYTKYIRDKEVDGIVGKKTIAGYLNLNNQSQKEDTWNRDVSTQNIDGCAQWVTKKFEDAVGPLSKQNGVISNAWQMPQNVVDAGGKYIYNIYNDPVFSNIKDVADLKKKTAAALKNNPIDYSSIRVGDIVGIYMPSSNMHSTALKDGTTKNTHVGIVTGIDEDGIPIVEHNIHGIHKKDKANNLTGSLVGKPVIATVSRPKNSNEYIEPIFYENKESKFTIPKKYDNDEIKEFANSMAGAADQIKKIFPTVDIDAVQKIALAVQKRETNYMTNKVSDRGIVSKAFEGAKEFYKYNKHLLNPVLGTNFSKENTENKSSDLAKFKLSSLSQAERNFLNIHSKKDLENPTKAGLAALYYLSKNYDYFKRLQTAYPNLGITDADIEGLTILSYNQGMSKLSHIGFNEKTGKTAKEELESIRYLSDPDTKIKDITSTNWKYLGKLGKVYYDNFKGAFTPYIASAKKELSNITEGLPIQADENSLVAQNKNSKSFGGPLVQMANKFDGITQPTQQMDSRPAFPWIEMARQEEQAYQNAMQEPYFQVNGRISKDEWRERNKPRDPGQITQSKYPSGPIGLGQMIDEYAREAKYRANNGELMLHGKYGLPLAALAAGAGAAAGSVLPTILANPYVDAGLTSAFAAHGLNHTLNEGIDGWGDAAMTALEITPLGRVAKPMWDAGKEGLQYAAKELASDKLKWLYNEGDIFNASMKYNPNNFYREISKEAIDDAINSGVIRSGNTERYIGPFFGKGYTPWQREKYIIEGYPEKNDWIYANPYENAVYVMQDEPEVGKALMKEAFKKIPKNSNVGAEAFPYSNGSINSTPTTNFDYWKKYPLLGWRKNKFNVTETPQITAENAASITPEVTHFYHGSPVRFNNFSADFIGSGEGGSKVMRGINLWPPEKIGNAPKFANIKSPDAPLHLGVSSTPLGGELNPTVYDVSGRGLKLYTASPREVKGLSQSDLISQGYDGIQTPNQVTVFPESIGKLSIDKQSTIEDFIRAHPEVERWAPWTTDNQKMQNIIDMSRMSKWTPEQWTAAQDAAIARGDMAEAQRLRDLHFKVSAPNTVASVNGHPLQLYHGTDATFNAFDISKYGSTDGGTFGRGVYTTPIKTYAELYGKNNMPLYMKLDNPRDYRNSSINDLIVEKFAFGDDFATGNGIDGVIGRPSWKGFKGLEEYISHNPKNIKSSKAVTYDDNGVRIPLGKRDNFNINDIRYGLIPLAIGLSAYGLYNENQTNMPYYLSK